MSRDAAFHDNSRDASCSGSGRTRPDPGVTARSSSFLTPSATVERNMLVAHATVDAPP